MVGFAHMTVLNPSSFTFKKAAMKKFHFILPLMIAALVAIPFSANAEDNDAIASPPAREQRNAGSREMNPRGVHVQREPRKVEVVVNNRKINPEVIKAEVEVRQARRAAQLARERAQIARERAQLAAERAQLAQEKAEAANQRLREVVQSNVEAEKKMTAKGPDAPLKKREETQKRMQERRGGEGRNEVRGRSERPARRAARE
jgi:hypothetical protein